MVNDNTWHTIVRTRCNILFMSGALHLEITQFLFEKLFFENVLVYHFIF